MKHSVELILQTLERRDACSQASVPRCVKNSNQLYQVSNIWHHSAQGLSSVHVKSDVTERLSVYRRGIVRVMLTLGVFDAGFWDVTVEYAKNSPRDLLCRYTVCNQSNEAASIHVLPTLWFRSDDM